MNDVPVSRSQKKRDAKSVEDLAETIIGLTPALLREVPLDDDLREEVLAARRMTQHGARKRQTKLVAKLMRERDLDAIREFIEEASGVRAEQTHAFKELETLRDLILREASRSQAVREAEQRFPGLDGAALLSLAALFDHSGNKRYARELFRMLKAAQDRERFRRKKNAPEKGDPS